MLKDGHHKTKRREGTRNCFYCRKDVVQWQPLTWPQIKALYDYCGVTCPTALCCDECFKKPHEELYRIFWGVLLATEIGNYMKGEPSVIKDKAVLELFKQQLKKSGAVEEAKKFIDSNMGP